MDVIRYSAPRRLLTIARGHPYDRQALAALCAGLDEFDSCLVEQPAAQRLLNPATVQELDGLLYQHEVQTSNQVVVETISSLDGEAIEDRSLRRAMALGIDFGFIASSDESFASCAPQ